MRKAEVPIISLTRPRCLCLFLFVNLIALNRASAEIVNVHAGEEIGTVRQVYDGKLLPDIQANTFRYIDRLFPTRVVKRGDKIFPLPARKKQLENFEFTVDEKTYDLYDYVSLNRVSGILVIKNGEIAFEKYFLGNN